jgi:hypothetical protein
MNPFLKNMPNPMSMMRRNPMMNILQQYQQIKQNPNQLASFLQNTGMINQQQAQEIQKMGSHYGQIGQYLMNNGSMPENIPQETLNQAQNIEKGIATNNPQ